MQACDATQQQPMRCNATAAKSGASGRSQSRRESQRSAHIHGDEVCGDRQRHVVHLQLVRHEAHCTASNHGRKQRSGAMHATMETDVEHPETDVGHAKILTASNKTAIRLTVVHDDVERRGATLRLEGAHHRGARRRSRDLSAERAKQRPRNAQYQVTESFKGGTRSTAHSTNARIERHSHEDLPKRRGETAPAMFRGSRAAAAA